MTVPTSERLHIGIFGRRNAGKSTLVNALAGQSVSIVSSTPGTTTDAVSKPVELPGIGAAVLIDTAGFDDVGSLGAERVAATQKAAERVDIAILLLGGDTPDASEKAFLSSLKMPVLVLKKHPDLTKEGLQKIREDLAALVPEGFGRAEIVGSLVGEGDVVMLVMPQDTQAPRGRLILPQVQTLRELLDKNCRVVCCTPAQMKESLNALKAAPKLIITDSQAFAAVAALKPAESLLTSFSVLFARYKGDIDTFVKSAEALGRLTEKSRVLIAEACTHAPASEDIGRVKIPMMLRRKVGEGLQVDVVSGADFPADLTKYNVIIHCGACMFNRTHVLSRLARAAEQGVPMTNYGVAMAYLQGILLSISY